MLDTFSSLELRIGLVAANRKTKSCSLYYFYMLAQAFDLFLCQIHDFTPDGASVTSCNARCRTTKIRNDLTRNILCREACYVSLLVIYDVPLLVPSKKSGKSRNFDSLLQIFHLLSFGVMLQ